MHSRSHISIGVWTILVVVSFNVAVAAKKEGTAIGSRKKGSGHKGVVACNQGLITGKFEYKKGGKLKPNKETTSVDISNKKVDKDCEPRQDKGQLKVRSLPLKKSLEQSKVSTVEQKDERKRRLKKAASKSKDKLKEKVKDIFKVKKHNKSGENVKHKIKEDVSEKPKANRGRLTTKSLGAPLDEGLQHQSLRKKSSFNAEEPQFSDEKEDRRGKKKRKLEKATKKVDSVVKRKGNNEKLGKMDKEITEQMIAAEVERQTGVNQDTMEKEEVDSVENLVNKVVASMKKKNMSKSVDTVVVDKAEPHSENSHGRTVKGKELKNDHKKRHRGKEDSKS